MPEETQAPTDLEATIEKLLEPAIDGLLTEVREFMNKRVGEIDTRLGVVEKAKTPEQTLEQSKSKSESALEQRIKGLEDELNKEREARTNQEKTASSLRFDQTLGKILDDHSPLHKSVVQELLANRLKTDAVEKDGSWLTKDGKTLAESAKSFFETTEGSHFLPSNHRDGSGTKEPTKQNQEQSLGLYEQLAQAFANG